MNSPSAPGHLEEPGAGRSFDGAGPEPVGVLAADHLRTVDAEVLGDPDASDAMTESGGFTGVLLEKDGPNLTFVRTVVVGRNDGPCFYRLDSGGLIEYGNYYGGLDRGPSHEWDEDGNLIEEITDTLTRRWDASGRLVHLERRSSRDGEEAPISSPRVPPHPDEPGARGHVEAVRLTDLVFGDRVTYTGDPYTGTAVLADADGGCRAHTFIEGHEFGPFRVWSPSGGLIVQGVRGRVRGRPGPEPGGGLYGPVGPWHRWDERGRLLREVVHDALGNRIIRRELDESGDIVEQERYEPVVRMEDPVTGERRAAPWL